MPDLTGPFLPGPAFHGFLGRWSLWLRPIRGRPRRAVAALLVFAVTALGLGLLDTSAHAATRSVSIRNFDYSEKDVTVNVGDTVTWTNNDLTTHNVSGDGGLNSPDLPPGQTYSFTFNQPGTFTYHDRYDPDMQGTVHVVEGSAPTSSSVSPNASARSALLPPLPAPSPAQSASGSAKPLDSAPPGGDGQNPNGGKDLGDGNRLAPYDVVDGVKVFHLTAAPIQWEVSPGKVVRAYAFNGMIPGPVIRVNQGDRVRIIVQNNLPEPTSVHWHGQELPNDQDGVPDLTQPMIPSGGTHTYEWTAASTGTHWYHSHMGGDQEGKGLFGSFETVPRGGDIPVDHDYRLLVGDGYPLGFTFNGKSFPATTPLKAEVGQRVRIRLIGTGPENIHPIHLHGGYFEEIAQDGNMLRVPQRMDTIMVAPGQTYDLLVVPKNPGRWLLHCHIFSHSETSTGMTGLVTTLDVAPPSGPGSAPPVPGLPSNPVVPVNPVDPSNPVDPGRIPKPVA